MGGSGGRLLFRVCFSSMELAVFTGTFVVSHPFRRKERKGWGTEVVAGPTRATKLPRAGHPCDLSRFA